MSRRFIVKESIDDNHVLAIGSECSLLRYIDASTAYVKGINDNGFRITESVKFIHLDEINPIHYNLCAKNVAEVIDDDDNLSYYLNNDVKLQPGDRLTTGSSYYLTVNRILDGKQLIDDGIDLCHIATYSLRTSPIIIDYVGRRKKQR